MKHFIRISILIISAFILSSCNNSTQNPILLKETNAVENKKEEKINYTIEKVVLSKGYQVLEPNVKFIKKDAENKLLISLGLVNSSGADVTEVIKSGSQIDIHIKNKTNKKKVQLVVPQIMINLKDSNLNDINNLSFNIINKNYEPVPVKIDANEAINKINADFGICTHSLPDIEIVKFKEDLFWNLYYKNIFDKYNKETPLVNLSVKIDANTGDIVRSSKTFISSLIDEGYILDYILDKYILYKKRIPIIGNEKFKEELWVFDIEYNKKEILYSSKSKITTAQFSPDSKSIGIIESVDNNNSLYVVDINEKKAYKVLFTKNVNPDIIRWKDNGNIYIVYNRASNAIIYNYNIQNDVKTVISSKNEHVVGLNILDEMILISNLEKDGSKSFYLTDDSGNIILRKKGITPNFISKNMISFLENKEKENKDVLYIYDLKKDKLYDNLDLNISNIYSIDDENVFIIEKNQNTNDYTLHKYNINNKEISTLAHINNSNIYLNGKKDIIYLDSALPYDENKTQIIYSLDLKLLEN